MKRFSLLAVIVLACSTAQSAPPGVEPELVGWWDNWHDANGNLVVPQYRSVSQGTIALDDRASFNELWVISVEPTTGPIARRQATVWMNHWGFWKRTNGPIVNVP